jgi:hypothetical protein
LPSVAASSRWPRSTAAQELRALLAEIRAMLG